MKKQRHSYIGMRVSARLIQHPKADRLVIEDIVTEELFKYIDEHIVGLCGTVHCNDEECEQCKGMKKVINLLKNL